MSIGEKIKNRRIELGWSQQKLADMMGYTSKSTITRIEKGNNDVSQKNIEKFAKVLGVSIAYLMDWEEPGIDYILKTDNPEMEILIEKISHCTEDQIQKIREYAEYILSKR